MKIVGVTGLDGLWALKGAWPTFFWVNRKVLMRTIHFSFYSSIKTVGATVLGGLWALEWAWHFAETNLRCVRSSGICTPNLNSPALIVSEITAFIRTDRQTDRRSWLDRLG